jgi:menaquinone-dependent protoporphyrinogen oxidase
MSASVLVAYATQYGSTQQVAEAIAQILREGRLEVDIQPMREVRTLENYHAVVLGAALYIGRWHKDARRFLSRHREALTQRPVAIFALGPLHLNNEKEWQDAHRQLEKELATFAWLTPIALELFGGKIDPAKLRFPWNFLLASLFKNMPINDIRDWRAIRTWASSLAAKLQPASSQTSASA